jgi:hypothetical protein
MRLIVTTCAFVAVLSGAVSWADAQPGGGKKGGKGGSESVDAFVAKLMAFNKAKDGKLTKAELTDARLHALFDRADANKDGVVTIEELADLYAKESGGDAGGKGGPGGEKGKGGFDGKKGKGPKGGPPQPGVVLPPFVQDALNLTDDQKKEIADLQKEVDSRLERILTEAQRSQLREFRDKGPKGKMP